ncbi:3-hydroxyacyl-CoA dehydrogenase NAD-binding domain-containing protein [Natrinema sp. SYSU A 869]|uniref:3-hydroxyacyl-CoA dehydrogenase family protein n=1 Tax=Natrinema sp. SYSU A 869 TaxID=2871694 RepID=UPI002104C13E|nr:3-hydroxyacyl-CoA dehydrogenase NAD-binding domain-containing protein [Natrinema sp. SYSU A 869]
MGIDDIETVAVIGAGQMGRGISAVAALAGYETAITDIDESQLEEAAEEIEWSYGKDDATEAETEAALDRLIFTTEFDDAVVDADFVTEAAVEQQSVTQDIFADLDETAPEDAILATNTTGLNITELAKSTDDPNGSSGRTGSIPRC